MPVPVPGLFEALSALGAGRVLGLVTNDSEAPARAHLEAHQITHHFNFISGYDSGFGSKPDPGQLLGFCAATGMRAEATAMVGDSRHDLQAGRAAGMATHWGPDGACGGRRTCRSSGCCAAGHRAYRRLAVGVLGADFRKRQIVSRTHRRSGWDFPKMVSTQGDHHGRRHRA